MSLDPTGLDLDLHIYVDGSLDTDGRSVIEERMRTDADFADEVRAMLRQRDGLRLLFATQPVVLTRLPVPHAALRRFSVPTRMMRQGAIAASLLVVGVLGGWSSAVMSAGPSQRSLEESPVMQFASEGFSAHRVFVTDQRHPVEVGRDEEDHLTTWLTNRMGRKISAPDFTSAGLDLVGGRLLPSSAGPSAQLMYEDHAGDRVTLYLRAGLSRQDGSLVKSNGELKAVLWSVDDLDYALIGDVSISRLKALSRLTGASPEKGSGGIQI